MEITTMSKDAYYFPHDSNARNDQRLMKVRMKYGMEGYGIYFGIIEILREQSDYTLGTEQFDSIAFDLRVDVEKVKDIVLGEFVLFDYDSENDEFYSRSLKRRMERLDLIKLKRAEAGRIGGKSKASAKAKVKHLEASKVKNSKVKEIKERYNEFKDHLQSFIEEFGKESIDEFLNYWTEPNKSNTKMKFEMQPTWDTKRRLQRWVGNDFNSNSNNGSSKFKMDTTGNAYIAYCDKCGKSDFYGKNELNQDSKCCKGKLLHEKPRPAKSV